MNKENRKAAKERRAKEREHEAKVAHYKKIWSWAGPALIIVVIVGLIIASVLDSKRLSVKSASEDTSTASSAASASSASTSASASLQTDTSLTIEDGDTVNIDYVGSIDGVEFEGGNTKGNGADLVIGSHTYIDDFEEQLIGHHPGDSVDVTVTFPEDYGKDELNGKEALFKVTVNGIYNLNKHIYITRRFSVCAGCLFLIIFLLSFFQRRFDVLKKVHLLIPQFCNTPAPSAHRRSGKPRQTPQS